MSDDPKITIRHVEPGDYEGVARLFEGASVVRGSLHLPFPSKERWRQRLAEPPRGLCQLVAVAEGGIVGDAGLHTFPDRPRRRHAGAIGMAVAEGWQGRGVGTQLLEALVSLADDWLGLTRLELEVFADNARAIRLYERHGFVVEGTLRGYALREGRYADAHVMARLRAPADPPVDAGP